VSGFISDFGTFISDVSGFISDFGTFISDVSGFIPLTLKNPLFYQWIF